MRRFTPFTLPVFAFICVAFGCFYGLGAYPILDNNEGMYASIARSMSLGGDLIIPRLNGVPYVEKPPLLYWLMSVSLRLFGDSEWSARLVPALSLLGTIGFCTLFLKRYVNTQAALIAAIIMSSSVTILAIGRMVFFDMLFTCFITGSLVAVYSWYVSRQRVRLLLAYMLVALAVMSKGILALVLVGGTGLCFLIVERQFKALWLKAIDPLGILIFLLITAPWHIQAAMDDPNFAYFYFINEHVLRFLNLREPHDYYSGPFWYYVPRLIVYLLPWSFCLPLLAWRNPSTDADEHRLERFLWCWFGWMLVFFSMSTAKANYYMITGVPALVMLLACRISALLDARRTLALHRLLACGLLSVALVALSLFLLCADHSYFQPYCATITPQMMELTAALVLIGSLALGRSSARGGLAVLAASVFLVLPLAIKGVRVGDEELSQKRVADYLYKNNADEPVAIYRDFEEFSALAYYLSPKIMIINSDSKDLLYGKTHYGYDKRIFATLDDWLEWSSQSPTPTRILLNSLYVRDFRKRMQASPYGAKLHMGIQHFTRLSLITLSALPVAKDGSEGDGE